MRVLRSTLYGPMLEPLTTVVRDHDVIDSLESIRERPFPDGFTANDIFDMDEADIIEASHTAMARLHEREEREKNMAMLFYWTIGHFTLVTNHGTVATTDPPPLEEWEVRDVLRQIGQHPRYTNQSVIINMGGGTIELRCVEGKAVVLPEEEQ